MRFCVNCVVALAVSGRDLYVGGDLINAAGRSSADYVARWNGSAWFALGSNGLGTNGALDHEVYGLLASGTTLNVGGAFQNAAGVLAADYTASYGPIVYRPDGRIRKGSGQLVGDNIYNADGSNQVRDGAKPRGSTISFKLSIQNDGSFADRYIVHATGAATTMYVVSYYRGTTNITAAVVAGTYTTASLAPGAKVSITAKVRDQSKCVSRVGRHAPGDDHLEW